MASSDSSSLTGRTAPVYRVSFPGRPGTGFKRELWRRAGKHFAAAGLGRESADAYLAAGDRKTAATILAATGEAARLTTLRLEMGDFTGARESARQWLKELAGDPARREREETTARLSLAAALLRNGEPGPGRAHYLAARRRLRHNPAPDPARRGADWEALGRFGTLVRRPDLVRLGYEKALAAYGQTFNLKRLDCARRYLEAVAGDRPLCREIEERMAGWQPRSLLSRERERLFTALREWADE